MSKDTNQFSKTVKLSRRRFLSYAGVSSLLGLSRFPAATLFATILGGQSQKAWAASLGLQPRKLVQFTERGGPSRCFTFSFLTPYSSAGFNRNPMVATQYTNVGGRYIGVDYVTHSRNGIEVPTFFTHDAPAPGGGYRPMSDLLANLVCVQGVTTRNAGHGASQTGNFLPPGAKQSSSALSADASDAPFAGLNLQASSYIFKSIAGKSFLNPSMSGNWILNLLTAFQPVGSTQYKTNKAAIFEAYQGIWPLLDRLATNGHPGAAVLLDNRASAVALAETNFTELDTQWTALVGKYQSLVNRAIFDPERLLVGINDNPIGEGGSGAAPLYQLDTNQTAFALHLASDVRSAIGPTTNIPGLAERFAFIEYALKNDLTCSIAAGIDGISGLIRQSDGVSTFTMVNDQHSTGVYAQLYFNVLRHRALSACLLELIAQLKTASLFDDTVIKVCGEFNRNTREDMTGSDHGWQGKSSEFYCGAFNGPLIVGNLRNDNRLGWGAGGKIEQLGRQLTLVDEIVTLAHMLRVPAPFTSANPVVTVGTNGVVSNIGTTHWVQS